MSRNEMFQSIQKLLEAFKSIPGKQELVSSLEKAVAQMYAEDGRTIGELESRLKEARAFINSTYGAQNG